MMKKRGFIYQGRTPAPNLEEKISSLSTEYLVLILKDEGIKAGLELIKSLGFVLELNAKLIKDNPNAKLEAWNFLNGKGLESDDCIQMDSTIISVNTHEQYSLSGMMFLKDGKFDDAIQEDFAEAVQAGANSTPSFLINDQLIIGNRPFEEFQAVIEEELAQ